MKVTDKHAEELHRHMEMQEKLEAYRQEVESDMEAEQNKAE